MVLIGRAALKWGGRSAILSGIMPPWHLAVDVFELVKRDLMQRPRAMAWPRHEHCLERLPNLAKERPCLQEIARFNAVSKPAIYRREHVDCFLSFALIGIKPGSSDAGAQFERLCASDRQQFRSRA